MILIFGLETWDKVLHMQRTSMIQTEQLREKILSEQGFLQKSSVLTFTANLKQW